VRRGSEWWWRRSAAAAAKRGTTAEEWRLRGLQVIPERGSQSLREREREREIQNRNAGTFAVGCKGGLYLGTAAAVAEGKVEKRLEGGAGVGSGPGTAEGENSGYRADSPPGDGGATLVEATTAQHHSAKRLNTHAHAHTHTHAERERERGRPIGTAAPEGGCTEAGIAEGAAAAGGDIDAGTATEGV
jgi:hypothetical protein